MSPYRFFYLLRRFGGGNRVRTDDPLLAGQVLYQLSYTPIPLKKMLPGQAACRLLKTNKKETICISDRLGNG